MKIFIIFLFFFVVFNQNCNFDIENEIKSNLFIISQKKINKNFNEFHI